MSSDQTRIERKPSKPALPLTASRVLIVLLAIFLAACGSSTRQPTPTDASKSVQRDQIQQLLRDADRSPAPRRQLYLLEAARLLLDAKQAALAGSILKNLDTQSLEQDAQLQHQLLVGRWQLANGDPQAALHTLEAEQLLLNEHLLGKDQRRLLRELRAASQAVLGNHLASATERVALENVLNDEDSKAANADALWQELMFLPLVELMDLAQTTHDPTLRGWLSLSAIAKDNRGDLDQQLRQLDQWLATWPDHPASTRLPGGLELIQQLAASQPRRIAILLPLSGPLSDYGQSVMDGFLSAYYDTRQQGGRAPALRIYDTHSGQSIDDLFDQAVAEGAELVIGPLDKARVRQLAQRIGLEVPTLVLNRVDNDILPPLEMFQFALAPEDEAKQLAEITALQYERAMILAHQDERSTRVVSSFVDQWQALERDVVVEGYYQEQRDYSKVIKSALHLDRSETRAERISQILQSTVEFTPRRRQDIDFILLQAKPQQARSLVPLLAFHYAGDIPIYSTSQIYTGVANSADNDLSGVRFLDMPWILKSDPMRQKLEKLRPSAVQNRRLTAFGLDSYQLYPRLLQLEAIPNSRLYGKTGNLKLNQRRQLERDSLLAEFKRGQVVTLPMVTTNVEAKEMPQDERARIRQQGTDWSSGRAAGS